MTNQTLNTIMQKRKAELEKQLSAKSKQVDKAPEGYLKISGKNRKTFYCVTSETGPSGRYLNKEEIELARKLAQKAYDQQVLKAAEQELIAWKKLAKLFPKHTVEELYETLAPARKALVRPIIPTDQEFRERWEAVEYEPGWFKEGAAVYRTDRGERVRSKSEQLIANLLYRLGIPYRYEYPIHINVHGKTQIWRPDFLILDVRHRKEIILEHFGKMGDVSYAMQAFGKMKIYEENGFRVGIDILYSFEMEQMPADIPAIEQMIRRVLAEEGAPIV